MFRLIYLIIFLSIVYTSNLYAQERLSNIEIAVGEFKPYVSEFVEGYGEVTEKVTAILKRMGYSPRYLFMPWGQAENKVKSNQKVKGIRGTFPFRKSQKRVGEFIYSKDPVLEGCMSFFYNKKKVSLNHIEFSTSTSVRIQIDELKSFRLGSIAMGEGFEYPEEILEYLPPQIPDKSDSPIPPKNKTTFNNAFNLFKALIDPNYKSVEVIPFQKRVGKEILYDLFPEARDQIGIMENKGSSDNRSCFTRENFYFIVSRINPENVEFMKNFDQAQEELGEEALERIRRRVEERSSGYKPNIVLTVHDISLPIIGYEGKKAYILPRGTRGELLNWNPVSENKTDSKNGLKAEARIYILTGPYRGKTLLLDGKFIELIR
ncbi:MAG: hypothetical protein G3M70_17715 [Candidatus Nitronauta litoralis]|uniref:Uncharacterized protein n=1 Tax=Candidatus Nitronauta litoralis TaxID=2705533 RepID=A0A7T0BZ51_9BACT|nr:MAG: hypothetical protein G3M70_17715 [Candidatus Nitronauta litoralis]